jgi:acetolactate synthase-1/2/3 large subunit
VSYRTGKGVIDGRHYLSLQQPQAERYWKNADVVLSVGSNMRVPLQKWARRHRPKIIRIDVDPSSHNKFARPDVAITARAEDAMAPLIGAIKALGSRRESRETELHDLHQWWRNESAVLAPQLEYLAAIRDALGEDGIFVDELTQVGFASRIAWPAYHPRTFITTGYQGTLGYGFPTALGVKVARPDVPVASVTGDGGFMFAVQELATAVQHRIPVVVLLFNNNQYGNVQQMQKHDYGGRVIASDLINPDFVQLARAYGAHAVRANSADAVATAIRAARGESLPTVVEIPVDDMPSVDQFR